MEWSDTQEGKPTGLGKGFNMTVWEGEGPRTTLGFLTCARGVDGVAVW